MKMHSSVAIILLLALTTSGQTSNRRSNVGDRGFQQFFGTLRTAMRKRDRETLRSLMTRDFQWAGDGHVGPDQAISYISGRCKMAENNPVR
jgi:hypothetical protein